MLYNPYTMHIATTESLDAITKGLDLKPEDLVVAPVCSGDEPFAIAEHARVTCSDVQQIQVQFGNHRKQALLMGNLTTFLHPTKSNEHFHEYVARRNGYFLHNGRISQIRANLGRVQFSTGDVFELIAQQPRVDKAYLSNLFKNGDWSFIRKAMDIIAARMTTEGLVYLSHVDAEAVMVGEKKLRTGLHPRFVLDTSLTAVTAQYKTTYDWKSYVFRKIF